MYFDENWCCLDYSSERYRSKQFLYFISEHYGDNWDYLNYSGNTVAVGHCLAVMNNRYTQTNMISAGDHKQTIVF